MTANLLSAIAVFVSTSIDYLVILTIVFAQTRSRRGVTHVTLGLYLGTAILVISSLLAAYVLHFIPEEWIIGLLGLIPIALGIYVAVRKEDDDEDEEDELAERFEHTMENRLFWTMTLITIASGGDNIGVYIPYFASLDISGIISAILTAYYLLDCTIRAFFPSKKDVNYEKVKEEPLFVVPLIILASATILIGLCASPLLNLIASYM